MQTQNLDIKELSQFILDYASSQKQEVTNFDLQKILYLLWIESYKQYKYFLFDTHFQAGSFGPYIPIIYYDYCHYTIYPINKRMSAYNLKQETKFTEIIPLLDHIFKIPKDTLKQKVREPGLAWDKWYNISKEAIIPFLDIINLDIQQKLLGESNMEESKQNNPYEKINQQLKEGSEKVFHSTDINEQDVKDLKNAMETAKVILTRIEPNETTDFIQSFLNFVIKICG